MIDLPFVGWWEELQLQLCCGSIFPGMVAVLVVVAIYLYKRRR